MKKLLLIIPLVILIVSAVANIVTAASVSDVGAAIHDYEVKTIQINAHADEMQQELATKQSLTQLKAWAVAAGFVPHTQVVVVGSTVPKLASIATP